MSKLKIRYPSLKLIPNTLFIMAMLSVIFYLLTKEVGSFWVCGGLSLLFLVPIIIISFVRHRIFIFDGDTQKVFIYDYILCFKNKKKECSVNEKDSILLTKIHGTPMFRSVFRPSNSWAWLIYLDIDNKQYLLTSRFFKKIALQYADEIKELTGIKYKVVE